MRFTATKIVLICLVSGAACTNEPQPPVLSADGVVQYVTSRTKQTIQCDGRPIDLAGNRNFMTLTGPCRFVRVSGAHNDVFIDVIPGGTIEITGDHNDVSWRRIEPGPRPTLEDRGKSNTFHRLGNDI
jgi:Protein of unknown function (DUF3060)